MSPGPAAGMATVSRAEGGAEGGSSALLELVQSDGGHVQRGHVGVFPRGTRDRVILLVMARKVEVTLVDDIDGGGADETVAFALDGKAYEIDLSKKNAGALRRALKRYTDSARRAGRAASPGRRSRSAAGRTDRERTADIREWARANGREVSDRGRIPASVVDAYDAAH